MKAVNIRILIPHGIDAHDAAEKAAHAAVKKVRSQAGHHLRRDAVRGGWEVDDHPYEAGGSDAR